jgi:AraC-like DNA-binding protein
MQVRKHLTARDEALSPWLINYLYAEIDAGDQTIVRQITARPTLFVQFIVEGSHRLRCLGDGVERPVPPVALFAPNAYRSDEMLISGKLRTLSARLQPSAGHLLFGLDMSLHLNGFVVPNGSNGIIDILQAQDCPEAMTKYIGQWLHSNALTAQAKDNVSLAAEQLLESNGALEIAALAKEAALSQRHFQRSFVQQVGLPPKAYARLCRLSHAIYMHEQFPKLGWSEIAYGCGYADQSHLARDFRDLEKESPSQFRRYQWLSDRDADAPKMSETFKATS